MSDQRTHTESGHVATLERLQSALQSEREFNRMCAQAEQTTGAPGRIPTDLAEDNLINFLHALEVKEVRLLTERVLHKALWDGVVPPSKDEMQDLQHVDGFCRQLAVLEVASVKNVEEAERMLRQMKKGKRVTRGPKVSPVHEAEEDLVTWLGAWHSLNVVRGLRTAERLAAYYGEKLPSEEMMCDLVLLRAIIDKVADFAELVAYGALSKGNRAKAERASR